MKSLSEQERRAVLAGEEGHPSWEQIAVLEIRGWVTVGTSAHAHSTYRWTDDGRQALALAKLLSAARAR